MAKKSREPKHGMKARKAVKLAEELGCRVWYTAGEVLVRDEATGRTVRTSHPTRRPDASRALTGLLIALWKEQGR